MNRINRLIIGGLILVITLTGCRNMYGDKTEDVAGNFIEFQNMYPMKDLTEFYDLEGDHDSSFGENDLGRWSIHSSISYPVDKTLFIEEGVHLKFNRNTRTNTGNYYIRNIKDGHIAETIKYKVEYVDGKIQLLDTVEDIELYNKIINFKFLLSELSFSTDYLENLEIKRKIYRSEAPLYSIRYKLPKEDKNLLKIKEIYPNFKIEDDMALSFDASGTGSWNRHGSRELTIYNVGENQITVREYFNYNLGSL